MIENTFIKKVTAGILRNHKMTIVERNIMHPERDWWIGIFVGVVLIAAAGIWSVHIYIQFKNISVTSLTESSDTVIYKEHLVNSALTDFSERKQTYELLKKDLIDKREAASVLVPPVATSTTESTGEVTEGMISADAAVEESPAEPVVEEQRGMEVIKME